MRKAGELAALQIELGLGQLPEADALLELLGASSITHLPASDEEILEPAPGTTPPWQRTRVRALFGENCDVSRAAALLRDHFGASVPIETGSLADSAWQHAAEAQPCTLQIGERLLITDATSRPASDRRTVVRLNRGLGFGTGQHPTTALCLEWLASELDNACTVVDYGCGSGILAVSALRLGAGSAYAVDIEPQAIEATIANATLNDVADRLWAGHPDELGTRRVDVVLANILAEPLITLAPRLAALTNPGGTVVLTGILPEQAARVREVYARWFAEITETGRDGWARLVGRRTHQASIDPRP